MSRRRSPTATGSPRSLRGFTLVEAIATITIVGILAVMSSRLMMAGADGYAAAATRAELINNASAAMERIGVLLRDIPLRAGASPAAPAIVSITPGSIQWHGGLTLSHSGGSLILGDSGANSVLAADVSSFALQTFDESNAALATTLNGDACDAVRRVQVTLTLSRAGVSETLRSRFFLRCMVAGAGD